MGIVVRQSFWVTVFSYLGVVIGYFNVLYLYPKALTTDQIGLMRMVIDAAMFLVPFAQVGLGHGIVKFYPTIRQDPHKRKEFLGNLTVLAICSFVLFLVLFFFFKPVIVTVFSKNAGEVSNFLNVILLLTLILGVYNYLESYARATLQAVFVNFVKDVLMRLFSAALISLYFFQFISIDQVIYGLLFVYGMAVLVVIVHFLLKEKPGFSFQQLSLKNPLIRELLAFSAITFLGTSGSLMILKLDSLMVGSLLGLDENGIYTTVFYIALVIEIPRRAVTQVITPLYSKHFDKNELDQVESIYKKTALNQLIVGLLIFVGIVFNLQNVFWIMPNGEAFRIGFWVTIIIGFSKLIDMSFGLNNELILMSKYYRFLILGVLILGILTVLTNLWLIPILGINGAALASLISILIFNLLKVGFIYWKYRMHPFGKKFLPVLLLGGIIGLIGFYFPQLPNALVDIFVRSSLMAGIYLTGIIYFNLSVEIKELFNQAISYLKNWRS